MPRSAVGAAQPGHEFAWDLAAANKLILVMERGVLYGMAAQSQLPIIIDSFDSSFTKYNLLVIALLDLAMR